MAAIVGVGQAQDIKHGIAALHRRPVNLHKDFTPDHHARQFTLVGLGGVDRADLAGVAHHGDAVGNLDDFLELVRDEDDGLAAINQVADGREQVLRLAGRQHGGRLVEDQDLGAAVRAP